MGDHKKTMKYTLNVGGVEMEPLTLEDISTAAEQGEYDSTALYWSKRLNKWMPVTAILNEEDGDPLESMKGSTITKVMILGSGTDDDCPVCAELDGRTFPIDEAPSLPPPGCTCLPWCRSVIVPAG